MMELIKLRDHAADQAVGALGVLLDLMGDEHQAGPVRVAAAKGVIDYALKLADQAHEESLQKLDELFAEFRERYQEENQG